jgi:hypothetical protein
MRDGHTTPYSPTRLGNGCMTLHLKPRVMVTLTKDLLILDDGEHAVRASLPARRTPHPKDPIQLPVAWITSVDPTGELLSILSSLGWLSESTPILNPSTQTLRDAICRALIPLLPPTIIVTAHEALILGHDDGPQGRSEALRRFISRLDWRRLKAYSGLTWRDSRELWVWGDFPSNDSTLGLDPSMTAGGSFVVEHFPAACGPGRTDSQSPGHPIKGRLDLVAEIYREAVEFDGRSYWLVTGTYAQPNLAFVPDPSSRRQDHRWCMGVSPELDSAVIKTRAEGVERYLMGDYSMADLVRAPASELTGSVLTPDQLLPYSHRQRQQYGVASFNALTPDWWVSGAAGTGWPTWMPACVVYCPFGHDPEWILPGYSSSNGAAAHTSVSMARQAGWLELNERDAFLRTFLSRDAPPRCSSDAIPSDLHSLMVYAQTEYALTDIQLVRMRSSLGLEVIGCVASTSTRFAIGASCKLTQPEAMEKAITEVVLQFRHPFGSQATEPKDVTTPEDHARLYSTAHMADTMRWMFQGHVEDICGSKMSADEVETLMCGGYFFDKTAPDGLYVSKALDPRLIPMTFGFDTLPEDHPPVRNVLAGSRRLLIPHPFP